ncbi:MAG: glycosyltransferase family 39 protein [Betaproteobacteria bacterium]|nr:glycosyltransferase family 39 protein [Betaproteobacteria bacterium]
MNPQMYSTKYSSRDLSGTIFLLLIAAYFLLQAVIRINLGNMLDNDEAEQVLLFQHLAWGYDTQPPLYNWLQSLMFACFGVNVFSLAVLKNLLLFGTYASMFYLARPLVGTAAAIAVSASLLLLPQIVWESQRDLTHSVLLTWMACVTLWCYFSLLRNPVAWRYALFGLLIGLGLQSKYNFILFVFALACSSLLIRSYRRILWNKKMFITAAVAVLSCLPHGIWLLSAFDAASQGTFQKLNTGRHAGYLSNLFTGASSIFVAVVAFLTPLWLIYSVICFRYRKQAAFDWHDTNTRFFISFLGTFLALLMLMALTGKVTHIKSRWLQSILFFTPLAFFVIFPGFSQPRILRRIVFVSFFSALLVLLALPFRFHLIAVLNKHVPGMTRHIPVFTAGKNKKSLLQHAAAPLADELTGRFPHADTWIVSDTLTGGNLRFHRPQTRVLLMGEVLSGKVPLKGDILLVSSSESPRADWHHFLHTYYPDSIILQEGRIFIPDQSDDKEAVSFDYLLFRTGSSS